MVKYNKRTIEVAKEVSRVLLKARVNVLSVFQIHEITKLLIRFNK